MHEDVLGLPLQLAQTLLEERGVLVREVLWTKDPKNPQEEGTPRVVAIREEGCVLVAARFLGKMPREQA